MKFQINRNFSKGGSKKSKGGVSALGATFHKMNFS